MTEQRDIRKNKKKSTNEYGEYEAKIRRNEEVI